MTDPIRPFARGRAVGALLLVATLGACGTSGGPSGGGTVVDVDWQGTFDRWAESLCRTEDLGCPDRR